MATAQLATLLRHMQTMGAGHRTRQQPDRQLLDAFAARHDQAAFAALVERHGPMVLRVCRRVLRQEQDAEDAFQATFLVLARSTASIRKREAVADWLHGVAYRTAMKAKRSAARRRSHEGRLRAWAREAAPSPSWDEVQAVLDEEIRSLPEPFRAAFTLCVLEGKSGPAAAAELGCKAGTVSSRLTRARKQLQQRLTRRGIKLSALLAALSVAEHAGRAALPPALARTSVRFGLLVAAGEPAAGVIPPGVAELATGVTRAMFLTKTKLAAALLLAVGLVVGAGALARQALAAGEPPAGSRPSQPEAPARGHKPDAPAREPGRDTTAKLRAANDKDSLAYSGRVLGPDGRPVPGAKLYLTPLWSYLSGPSSWPEYATTGPDGRFQFTAPKAKFADHFTVVAATAANHGPGWVMVPAGGRRDDLTLQLVKDDVPITGQIVDLEGKAIPGVTLTVLQISAAPGEDLGPWLEAVKGKKGRSFDLEQRYLKRYTVAPSPRATTDAAGNFRLSGIGRNRLVVAQLDGPAVATQQLHILTRPGKAVEAMEYEGRPEYNDPRRVTTYYGVGFRHVAGPTKPIVGVVRDKDTKQPLAGVSVRSFKLANHPLHYSDGQETVRATTDAQGRYRLTGMPKGVGNKIKVVPPGDLPYLAAAADVHDSPGLGPVTVDFELKRGVWIEGKITDKVTGQSLRGGVHYIPLYSNPNRRDYPGVYEIFFHFGTVKEDGSYRIVGLPGPGMVAVYGLKNHYLRVSQREDEYGAKGLSDEEYPMHLRGSNCAALTRVNPAKGAGKVLRDVTLDPGRKIKGTVLGPDGQPLPGTRNLFLAGTWWDREATKTAEFAGWFNPHETPEILFQHPEKGLIGVVQPPKENGGSVTVRLEPGATVTGRLVDADGQPRAGVELEVAFLPKGWGSWRDCSPEPIQTDREGRFRLTALLPGREFRLSDGQGELPFRGPARSGQAKDLGDVRIKRAE
jgi:RNA polymerase sigma factor (sigma-70 family)